MEGDHHERPDLSDRLDRRHHGNIVVLRIALMTIADELTTASPDVRTRYVNWTPIFLGALTATAFSSILLTFGGQQDRRKRSGRQGAQKYRSPVHVTGPDIRRCCRQLIGDCHQRNPKNDNIAMMTTIKPIR